MTNTLTRKFRHGAAKGSSDVIFPLTPPLSLGEREFAHTVLAPCHDQRCFVRPTGIHTLPEGVGWGEGEQGSCSVTPSEVSKRSATVKVSVHDAIMSKLPCRGVGSRV